MNFEQLLMHQVMILYWWWEGVIRLDIVGSYKDTIPIISQHSLRLFYKERCEMIGYLFYQRILSTQSVKKRDHSSHQ
jgi:hypothetical protein